MVSNVMALTNGKNRLLKPPRTSEHTEQALVIKWAEAYAWRDHRLTLLFAIPNGRAREKRTAALLKREGVRRGVPDLFLPAPSGGKCGLFIEMKRKGGRLTEEQKQWISILNALGYSAVVCYSAEEAINTIMEYLDGRFHCSHQERAYLS